MNEIGEVLSFWLGTTAMPAPGSRTIAERAGVDRKTVRRYVEAAQAAGLERTGNASVIDDELIGAVVETVCATMWTRYRLQHCHDRQQSTGTQSTR